MTDPIHRKATTEEILHALRYDIKAGRKVSFRHFAMEYVVGCGDTTRTKQRGSSAVRVIDGKPFVKIHGKLEPLAATHCTLPSGQTFLWDYRIDSPHLPVGY